MHCLHVIGSDMTCDITITGAVACEEVWSWVALGGEVQSNTADNRQGGSARIGCPLIRRMTEDAVLVSGKVSPGFKRARAGVCVHDGVGFTCE